MFARLMGLKTVSPATLEQWLHGAGRLFVFDVNSRQSWLKGHVPGASHADPVALTAADLPDDKASALVFYCSGMLCRKAPNAARRAEQWGYRNVHVMSEGLSGWLSARFATESGSVA